MPRPPAARPLRTLLCSALCALGVAACGSTVSTSAFKGEQHEVAQRISSLQADATSGEQKKICAQDMAAAIVSRLGGAKACEAAIKKQIAEIDSLETSVQSVQIASGGATATAHVKSTYNGRSTPGTVALVKEGKLWKVSAVG